MITDKNRLFDGWLTLEGGVDAGRLPDTLEVNQCHSAINMTFRGGSITTRPGYRKLEEEFAPHSTQLFCYNNIHLDHNRWKIDGEYQEPRDNDANS